MCSQNEQSMKFRGSVKYVHKSKIEVLHVAVIQCEHVLYCRVKYAFTRQK